MHTGSYVNGTWYHPSGEIGRNVNPADTSDVIAEFPMATAADVRTAIDAATAASQRAGVENRHAGHAHVPLGGFLHQERVVGEPQGFEVVVVHGATPHVVVVCKTLPHPGSEVNALAPVRNKLPLKKIRRNC